MCKYKKRSLHVFTVIFLSFIFVGAVLFLLYHLSAIRQPSAPIPDAPPPNGTYIGYPECAPDGARALEYLTTVYSEDELNEIYDYCWTSQAQQEKCPLIDDVNNKYPIQFMRPGDSGTFYDVYFRSEHRLLIVSFRQETLRCYMTGLYTFAHDSTRYEKISAGKTTLKHVQLLDRGRYDVTYLDGYKEQRDAYDSMYYAHTLGCYPFLELSAQVAPSSFHYTTDGCLVEILYERSGDGVLDYTVSYIEINSY